MSDTFSKVEVITGIARRRRFSTDLKLAVVAETMQPGMSISYVARRHGLSPSLVFRWRRLMSEGGREAVRADDEVVPARRAAPSGRAGARSRTVARPQDHGERDSQGGARAGAGKKTDLAVQLCADGLEFTCWNGEVVRLAFALDCHDREIISWVATTAGISGEMIRDMMVDCVEKRFGKIRAPQPVQWLSDNGSIFAAHRTIEVALALNLVPCFTPVESPESNGMAEAFVKTFKRDYVRVNPIPNAAAALAMIDRWMEDYNTVHPHSRLGYHSPREYIMLSQSAACPA